MLSDYKWIPACAGMTYSMIASVIVKTDSICAGMTEFWVICVNGYLFGESGGGEGACLAYEGAVAEQLVVVNG
ncbi:MAG TPA: hypothetical protein VLL52_01785 [Anaerolineae bacterium]|nr:hypothetical protein [Anaerolineae bacterium]